MNKRVLLALTVLIGTTTAGSAGGTPEQQAACRPDTRRFCHHVKSDAGDDAFLACLQEHRAKLSPACRQVLESNGV